MAKKKKEVSVKNVPGKENVCKMQRGAERL